MARPTPESQRTFIDSWLEHGNKSRAQRQAGIGNRNTANRIISEYNADVQNGMPWEPRKSLPTRSLPEGVEQAIIRLATRHSEWGKRRIARELTRQFGKQVASESAVTAVLKRAGFDRSFPRSGLPEADPDPSPNYGFHVIISEGKPDLDLISSIAAQGIELDLREETSAAVKYLGHHLWERLDKSWVFETGLFLDRRLGALLLRSCLQYSHALMNEGKWSAARANLVPVWDWMLQVSEQVNLLDLRKLGDESSSLGLRWDDIYLGTLDLLGTVFRYEDPGRATAYKYTSLNAVERHHRPIMPINRERTVGNLERGYGIGLLRLARASSQSRKNNLEKAESYLRAGQKRAEHISDYSLLGISEMNMAELISYRSKMTSEPGSTERRALLDKMNDHIQRSLALMDNYGSPILRVNQTLWSYQLHMGNGMPNDIEWDRLIDATKIAVGFGYGGQAKKLARMNPVLDRIDSSLELRLFQLASQADQPSEKGV